MKKDRNVGLLSLGGAMLLVAGQVIAAPPAGNQSYCASDCVRQNPVRVSAPEIDASVGGGAIAVLVTVMLLVAERKRPVQPL